MTDWCAPPSGPERDAARRADEDRLAARVDPERPRLERACDERVVDRADRQQRLAVARPRRAELAEEADEVDLGDPELDVTAVIGLAPAHERVGVVGEPVDAVSRRPDPGLVDPAAEVGRGADVGRHGDDALRHRRRLAHEVDEEAPERLLGRGRALVLAAEVLGHAGRVADELQRVAGGALQAAGRARAQLRLRAALLERRPRVARVGAERCRELAVLLLVEQGGVVRGVALGRQLPALDRVGEHDRGAVAHGVGLVVGAQQPPEVVTAEVAKGGEQFGVVEIVGDDLEPPSQLLRVGAQQPLVLLVGHRVDALAQRAVRAQLRPVLGHHAVPARRLEHRGEPAGRDVGHDAVERLAVEVDDPQHFAEVGDHRVRDRLPDRALVELGVAEQRDLSPAHRDVEVARDVAVRDRTPDRSRRADPHRPRGVVDGVGVLRARGVGLEPAELPQRLEVARLQAPEQVVDRVQHGRRVRLDRDAVRRLEEREPQRGHQRHHRRARRLMAADLHARAVRPHVVGVMDDRRRQPQHAPLHAVEDGQLDGRGPLEGIKPHARSIAPRTKLLAPARLGVLSRQAGPAANDPGRSA